MNINKELDKLTTSDIYSMMLFALYKVTDIPEYSSLSQLSYILDKDSLLKLCEFYGGLTIKIPTIEQLQTLLDGLLIFQLIDLENGDSDKVLEKFEKASINAYFDIKDILKNYNFNSGRKCDDIQE